MKGKHRFRPSESWVLEDRVALTVGGGSAIAASAISLHGLTATFHGKFATIVPTGVGGTEQANLVGQSSLPRIGRVSFGGYLRSNGSLPPHFARTSGPLTFTTGRNAGSLTVKLTGPPSDLAPSRPTTTHLTFQVVKATGKFAAALDGHGTADLTLRTRPGRHGSTPGVPHGNLTLVLTES